MDQREILNELAQIVALTDPALMPLDKAYKGNSEAAQRAKGLIREIEGWPVGVFGPPVGGTPAPYVSQVCGNRYHSLCVGMSGGCACACHRAGAGSPAISAVGRTG